MNPEQEPGSEAVGAEQEPQPTMPDNAEVAQPLETSEKAQESEQVERLKDSYTDLIELSTQYGDYLAPNEKAALETHFNNIQTWLDRFNKGLDVNQYSDTIKGILDANRLWDGLIRGTKKRDEERRREEPDEPEEPEEPEIPEKPEVPADEKQELSGKPETMQVEVEDDNTGEQEVEVTDVEPEGQEDEVITPEKGVVPKSMRNIEKAIQKERNRTEVFVQDVVDRYMKAGAEIEAGIKNPLIRIKEQYVEARARKKIEKQLEQERTLIEKAKANLAQYEERYATIKDKIERLESIAERNPQKAEEFKRFTARLEPKVIELSGLIETQKALLDERVRAMKDIAAHAGMNIEAIEGTSIESGVPSVGGGGIEFSEPDEEGYTAATDRFNQRVAEMLGSEPSARSGTKISAVDRFFRFLFGLESKPAKRGEK